ncbi:MAG: hypothetical protein QOF37_2783 [Thermoleophilaceae bacterium]|nr:hypothetical protein [Thermoleophilaceae bacterium]
MSSVFAASLEANVVFALFLVIAGFGFVLGFFTIRGSGINNHPWDGRDGTPGSKLPDEFHQFADRQIHDADLRRAAREREDMTLDDINRRLAAEARARKAAAHRERTPRP